MIKQWVIRIRIIARNASMKANGANTERKEKTRNKSSKLL